MQLEAIIRDKTARIGVIGLGYVGLPLVRAFVAAACVLISTDHSAYDYEFIVRHAPLVIDTRNATRRVAPGLGRICKA